MAFDWTSLLTDTLAPMGGKILGEQLAPGADLMNAKQNQINSTVNNAINQGKFDQSTEARQLALPGMLRTLGYSPQNADSFGSNFGDTSTTFSGGTPGGSGGAPGTGMNLAKTALGAGMSFGSPLISGAIKAGAGALGIGGAAAGAAGAAIPGMGATALGAGGLVPAAAPMAVGGAGAGGGLMGTLGALATNPLTWVAAGALGAGLIWKKSQVHPTADKWVQGEQNPFDQTMSNIDTQVKGGSMSPDEAKQLKTKNAQTYLSELQQFSTQGSHQAIVAKQAADTFRQWYGDPAQYGIKLSF